MNRQGGRTADPSWSRRPPDWWRRLYAETATDTGRTTSDDTLDDRFASAVRTVRAAGGAPAHPPPTPPDREPAPPPGPPTTDPTRPTAYVPDTVLDGAEHGGGTLRAVSLRGETARAAARPRRDVLVTACLGGGRDRLLLVAVATAARPGHDARRAARLLCDRLVEGIGRNAAQLAADVGALRRASLSSGLRRLTDRAYATLRDHAADLGLAAPDTPLGPATDLADLRCLLVPDSPHDAPRVCFGVGDGGLFRLRDGAWRDLEADAPHRTGTAAAGDRRAASPPPQPPPAVSRPAASTPASPGELAAADGFRPAPAPPAPRPFRFQALRGRPGDTLLLCSTGLAQPLRDQASFAHLLARAWAGGPPGLPEVLGVLDTRLPGHGADRTAAVWWETSRHH